MNSAKLTFTVSEKTKQAFDLALLISGKDRDEVFELLAKEFAVKVLKDSQVALCKPPSENDFHPPKALAKIPVWATSRKGQIGAQIVKAFFLCEKNGVANRNEMREIFLTNNPLKTAWSFDGNFASMCTEKGNSHGLFFVLSGIEIRVAEEIKETLYKYRDDFLK